MGYTRHHAIVVTSWDEKLLKTAQKVATGIFKGRASNIVESEYNSFSSFFIAPDGSKENWPESDLGDAQRAEFIEWINDQASTDGGNSLSFCEFYYGDDDEESAVEAHN